MSYYNTTRDDNAASYRAVAKKQDDVIKEMILKRTGPFSPKDVFKHYPIPHTPFTSIRRSLDTLKKQGFIKETGIKVEGLYGRKELQLIRTDE